MMPAVTLALAGIQHEALLDHLFPSDGLEAAAIMLCARGVGDRKRLVVREIIAVPHERCAVREPDFITWPGDFIEQAIDRGEKDGLTIILVHSHPRGTLAFSARDDESDSSTMPCLFQAYGCVHGSAVMVPGGAMRARLYGGDLTCRTVDLVTVAGHEILHRWAHDAGGRPAAFTSAMTDELGRLTAVVIGVSGTGSITAEEAARMGFGRVILIDFDKVERKNLNRILNSTIADAEDNLLKVIGTARAITLYRGPGVAVPVPTSIDVREAIIAAAQGDVIFSCVDTQLARQVADQIASAFLIPLMDVGVTIPAQVSDDAGTTIIDAVGRIDYVQPGRSTLLTRGVHSPAGVRAEYLAEVDPEQHRLELEAGYFDGAPEEAPSVISLNMRAAATAMNEYILRAYPFRLDSNSSYARTRFSLAAGEEEHFAEETFDAGSNALLGRGGKEPLLGVPGFGPAL